MNATTDDARVYANLRELNLLQHRLHGISFLPRQPVRSLLSGRHASRVRGRGLNFEEIRHYQPGDDVRTIDWKVTARTREPHTRVFTEERDRPVLMLVDQRLGMFFGTQFMMKSVSAAHLAALTAWKILDQGDRIGAIVFNDTTRVHIPCRRSKTTVARILSTIVQQNHALGVSNTEQSNGEQFGEIMHTASRLARHNHLVVIISDFHGLNHASYQSLRRLTQHNDVLGMLVHDPSASNMPPLDDLVVSDGELQFVLGGKAASRRIAETTSGRLESVLQLQHELDMPILPISSGQETLPQLQKLLGGARRR